MIVLDTHVWLWLVAQDKKRLRSPMRRAIESALREGDVAVSVISLWELATKIAIGKLALSQDIDRWFAQACEQFPDVRIEPMSPSDAIDSTRLPGDIHRDPADRLIVTLARRLNARLATLDEKLLAYPHVNKI